MHASMAATSMVGIPKAALSMGRSMAISMVFAAALFTACISVESRAGFLYVPPVEPAAVGGSGTDHAPAIREEATDAADSRADERCCGLPGGSPSFRTVPDSAKRIGLRRANSESLDKNNSPGIWQVRAGEMLRETLGRWGERAEIEVLFLTDRRYRLHEGRLFHGSFGEASQALFAALSHLPHPPVGETRPDGRTLAVLHREDVVRPAGDDR